MGAPEVLSQSHRPTPPNKDPTAVDQRYSTNTLNSHSRSHPKMKPWQPRSSEHFQIHLCDALQVGVGALTFQEQRAHFAVWAIMKSPLMLGTDLNSISQDQLDMVSNSEVRLTRISPTSTLWSFFASHRCFSKHKAGSTLEISSTLSHILSMDELLESSNPRSRL